MVKLQQRPNKASDRIGAGCQRAWQGPASTTAKACRDVAPSQSLPRPTNSLVAALLRQGAEILASQDASLFRVRAYRRAADLIEDLPKDVGAMVANGGQAELRKLPGIGEGLAMAVAEIAMTGRWSQLERLRGQSDPVRLLRCVPGVGPKLAERIHEALGIESLEELEGAAHDGRLRKLEGLGPRRVAAIKASLAMILGQRKPLSQVRRPSVEDLLAIDRLYRQRVADDKLPLIAPRRFNPTHEAWLPILHEDRGDWRFTALFSNTARAHELGKTFDWVVVYYEHDGEGSGQATVVTETSGPLKGRRVVRGRELETRRNYGT